MQERTSRGVGSWTRKKICNLDHAVLVEEFGLKNLGTEIRWNGAGERGMGARLRTGGSFAWWKSLRAE